MMSDTRRPVFICGPAGPDGTLICPRCGRPTVYRDFYPGEPICDARGCHWRASRARLGEEWREPA